MLVSEGEGVETRYAHTEWPGVHATSAVADAERIAAVGPRELAVYDRRVGRERFRVKVGESWQVALLPEGRTAAVSGPYGKKQLRVFDWNGAEVSVYRMNYASAAKASPSGLLATLSGTGLPLIDLRAPRGVAAEVAELAEVAWLDDERIAVLSTRARVALS